MAPNQFPVIARLLLATAFIGSPLVTYNTAQGHDCFEHDAAATACQATLQSNETAPAPGQSLGIRLNHNVSNVLFNSYGLSCRFVDNNGPNDYFIPQNTIGEFNAFIQNLPFDVIMANCVPPVSSPSSSFKASASIPYPTYQILAEGGAIIPMGATSIATLSHIAVPTDQSYGRVATARTAGTVTSVSLVAADQNPIAFYYTREDCRVRSDGTPLCATRNIKEMQNLIFAAQPSNPAGSDGTWAMTQVVPSYYAQNTATGAWTPIAGPTADYEPPAEQSCMVGGITHSNGQTWSAAVVSTQTPSAADCPYGAGTRIDTMSTMTNYICNDGAAVTQSLGTPQLVASSGACAPSPFQTNDDGAGAHAYLYQLTPLNYRNGLQGYGGNVNLLKASNRLPDVEFYATQVDVPDQDYSLGFPGYPNLNTWFGVCYDGGFVVPATGQYTFVMAADDGAALWIDGVLMGDYEDNHLYSQLTTNIGNESNNMVLQSTRTVTMQPGTHSVMIKYYQGWASNLGVRILVQAPGQPLAPMQMVNPPNGTLTCPH